MLFGFVLVFCGVFLVGGFGGFLVGFFCKPIISFITNTVYLELIEKNLCDFLPDTNHMPCMRISWITQKSPRENMLYRLLLVSGD